MIYFPNFIPRILIYHALQYFHLLIKPNSSDSWSGSLDFERPWRKKTNTWDSFYVRRWDEDIECAFFMIGKLNSLPSLFVQKVFTYHKLRCLILKSLMKWKVVAFNAEVVRLCDSFGYLSFYSYLWDCFRVFKKMGSIRDIIWMTFMFD